MYKKGKYVYKDDCIHSYVYHLCMKKGSQVTKPINMYAYVYSFKELFLIK